MPEIKIPKRFYVSNGHTRKPEFQQKLSIQQRKDLYKDSRFTTKEREQYTVYGIIPDWFCNENVIRVIVPKEIIDKEVTEKLNV